MSNESLITKLPLNNAGRQKKQVCGNNDELQGWIATLLLCVMAYLNIILSVGKTKIFVKSLQA